jgi:hypothetical protein
MGGSPPEDRFDRNRRSSFLTGIKFHVELKVVTSIIPFDQSYVISPEANAY